MILADDLGNDKGDRALAEWVQGESARVASEILQRRVGGVLTDPVPSSNRTCGFPTSGSPTIVALH